ncbi:MAG: phosphohistidine phosphatase SixA [Roseiflexaceae bacterium]
MELYFLRHGVAADYGPPGTGDAGRPLTPEGIEKMTVAARGLRRLDLRLDMLLSSPLVRAHETAGIVAKALGLELRLTPELSPGCDTARLRRLLAAHGSAQRVMVVGHEPDFSTMIGDLTGAHVQMKKGGLALVDLPTPDSDGILIWLMTSRVLRAAGRE